MSEGYNSQILEVNLSAGRFSVERLEPRLARHYIGGLGLGIRLLYDEVGPQIDALSPENIIVVAPGALTGTGAPTGGRTQITTKSPLTGIIGTGNFGGAWGHMLKYAGYEALVVRGQAGSPVYLWIDDDRVEIRNAGHLWGRDTWETTDLLKKELGADASVLAIGPAGENLVRSACPVVDYHHAAGRSHAGAVMGAKKLKAIAVRGTKKVPVAHPEEFKEAVKDFADRLLLTPEGKRREKAETLGTELGDIMVSGQYTGRNFQTGVIPADNELWRAPEAIKPHLVRGNFCHHCPLGKVYGCDLIAEVKGGSHAGLKVGGVFCWFSGWGLQCDIKDFPAVWKCRELCQRLGLDQGGTVPFALELYQRGILTREDCDGRELGWADESAVTGLLKKIACREGIGDTLAEGSQRAAQKIGRGAERYVMTVKGMELCRAEPRAGTIPMLLGFAVSPRGGDDQFTTVGIIESWSDDLSRQAREAGLSEEEYLLRKVANLDMLDEVKREIYDDPPTLSALHLANVKGKVALVKWYQELTCATDALGLCIHGRFVSDSVGPTPYARLYSAATGRPTTPQELMKAGERIFNLMRAYLVREGITRKDDTYPARFFEEPIPDGPRKDAVLSRERMDKLLDVYYQRVGWDKQTGSPTREKLSELGLDDVVQELWG
ncbi:MAG: aldehyde ferredoxin oxidoreductase family protein [Chloroflexota bacterium]